MNHQTVEDSSNFPINFCETSVNGNGMCQLESTDNHNDLEIEKAQVCHSATPMVSRLNFCEIKAAPVYSYNRADPNYNRDENTSLNIKENGDVSDSLLQYSVIKRDGNSPEITRNNDTILEEKDSVDINDIYNDNSSGRSGSPASLEEEEGEEETEGTDESSEQTPVVSTASPGRPQHHPGLDLLSRLDRAAMPGNNNLPLLLMVDSESDDPRFKIYHQLPKAIDRDAARRLARRLFECDGFKITDVAKHLSKRNDFSQIVGEEFANFFDFTDLRLDVALRQFLARFTLTGETQERERVMHHFSRRYVTCNSSLYNGEDACHTLVCALIILNTNLHSQVMPKMSCVDFVNNLKELNEGENFPTENLQELFGAIEQQPIRWPTDDELVNIVNVAKPEMMELSRQYINPHFTYISPPSYDINPQEANSRDFMRGYVVRKWLKENGGRKTSILKRGWRLHYARLRDLTIYLYKDHKALLPGDPQPPAADKTRGSLRRRKSRSRKSQEALSSVTSTLPPPSDGDGVKVTAAEGTPKPDEDVKEGDCTQPGVPDSNSYPQVGPAKDETPTDPQQQQSSIVPLPPPAVPALLDPSPQQQQTPLVLSPASLEIPINHALASRANDYVKKKHVLRIRTKYGSEYLFEVNNEKELNNWIDNINYAASLLSDPEPIIGITTMEKMGSKTIPRPKITSLNMRDQLESHQKCVLELEHTVASMRESTPAKKSATDKRMRIELDEAIRFRTQELQRYKIYSQLLEMDLMKQPLLAAGNGGQIIYNPVNFYNGGGGGAIMIDPQMMMLQQQQHHQMQQQQHQMRFRGPAAFGGPANNIRQHQRLLRYRQVPQGVTMMMLQPPPPPLPPPMSHPHQLPQQQAPLSVVQQPSSSEPSDLGPPQDHPATTASQPDQPPSTTSTTTTFYEIV